MSSYAICPANQPAAGDAAGSKETRHGRPRLSGIRSDDLQVRPRAECEQRVVRAEADVLATSLGPDAEAFLHVADRCSELGGGVDEMVNQHLNLNPAQVVQVKPLSRGRSQQTAGPRSRVSTAGRKISISPPESCRLREPCRPARTHRRQRAQRWLTGRAPSDRSSSSELA